MAKLKLIQDAVVKMLDREALKARELPPPLPPFPPCDLCLNCEADLILPDGRCFCGDCWRAHEAVQFERRKFERAEMQWLEEPEGVGLFNDRRQTKA